MLKKEFRPAANTGCSRRLSAFCSLPILFVLALAACDGSGLGNEDRGQEFSLTKYLCTLSEAACHSDAQGHAYRATADATYEIAPSSRKLTVPMGYVDPEQMLDAPRKPEKKFLFPQVLLPRPTPHSTKNPRGFLAPYERDVVRLSPSIRGLAL